MLESSQLYLGRAVSRADMLAAVSVLCVRDNMPALQKAQKSKATYRRGSTYRQTTRYLGV